MKAAQVVARHRIEIVEVEAPSLDAEAEGSLLVRPLLSGICGTDMPQFDLPRTDAEYPLNPGMTVHECIGVVGDSRSSRFREGDEVLALPRGHGALAECYVSHEAVAVPVVPGWPREQLLMAQPLGTVIWAMRKLGNLLGKDAVVVGQGPNGLLIAHMLSNLGVRTIVATDLHDYRLEVSKLMRATHTVNPQRDDPGEVVMDLTNGRGADLVVEAVGHQVESINQCLKMVRRGGTVLAFGVPDDKVYAFRYREFFRRNITLIGTVVPEPQKDFPLAMDMIVQGRIGVTPLITHRLEFEQAQRGLELACNKEDGAIKVLFEYRPGVDG